MCKVYNQIGCLTQIKSHLTYYGLHEFQSLDSLIDFQKSYSSVRQQILYRHEILIENEKKSLVDEIPGLEVAVKAAKEEIEKQLLDEIDGLKRQFEDLSSPNSNAIQRWVGYFKGMNIKLKIRSNQRQFESKVKSSIIDLVGHHLQKNQRYDFIISNFENAVAQSSQSQIEEHDRKKRVIDLINNEIYGALGEQQVVKKLGQLPDDHILINDFSRSFDPPIYNRKEDDYIQSIQIDHLLITPSGVFIIETKNWSERSINNSNFRSPVQQVKRINFALFIMLNVNTHGAKYILKAHPWGEKKIPIRNVVVFINHRPIEEFQHVKTLTLNELLGYVRYFKPCFSDVETRAMAGHLLALNVQ